MESKEYFEKVMQDYNQHRNGRSLLMYGEHVDYTFLPCGYVPRYKEGQDAA